MRPRCGRPTPGQSSYNGCQYERMKGKQQCVWHWLLKQPADVQAARARTRRGTVEAGSRYVERARVPAEEWPEGERWCAGCQSFVPLFYTSGSRCKACASTAAHAQRTEKLYGISGDDYDRLFRAQKGRCYICHRIPRTKRLAVDHDHVTGAVRGLLCANNENGCNRGVVANLEAAADGGLEAAKRAVLYLANPPWARIQAGKGMSWAGFVAQEHARLQQAAQEASVGTPGQPPPF